MTDARRTGVRPPANRTPAKQAHATVSPARAAAAEVLLAVWRNKGHSDDLLHGRALAGLTQEDRNLATALVLGVLRWQIALDARILPLLSRPDAVIADEVLLGLRMGAFQLLHMDRIPVHAAINESVELVRASGHPHATGMVNAVLRKLNNTAAARKPLHEPVALMAERQGHPAWLAERWVKAYGRTAATAICEFNQHEPQCGDLFAAEDGANLPLMDDGSRLVAEIAAASVPKAERVWDCCAAPGGKAMVLGKRHPDASILATDASPKRLRALSARLEREAASNIETRVADATVANSVEGEFDLVLCDVPCSGTGTLARNPEIRHHLRPSDLSRQAARQKAILKNALQHLAPEGRLIYSTCSLEPEECERVVEEVLAGVANVEQIPVETILDLLKAQGRFAGTADLTGCARNGVLRTLPGFNLQADGFFAAVLARR